VLVAVGGAGSPEQVEIVLGAIARPLLLTLAYRVAGLDPKPAEREQEGSDRDPRWSAWGARTATAASDDRRLNTSGGAKSLKLLLEAVS
jgi:hypothetical protein